jgi:hypothetical protein
MTDSHSAYSPGCYGLPRMLATPTEIEAARRRLVAWLKWYMRGHPEDAGTQLALAKRLGVSGPAVTYWFRAGSTRLPDFETLLSIKKLINVPLDVLLGTDPP